MYRSEITHSDEQIKLCDDKVVIVLNNFTLRGSHQVSNFIPPPLAPYRLHESGRPDQVSAGARYSLA